MKRTSRSIVAKLNALTVHISPYVSGLAPETHELVAVLNADRRRTGINFMALANRIEARGPIERAARQPTLCGEVLRRAIRAGFQEGEGVVLRRGNSLHRKTLRKRAKTKEGLRQRHQIERLIRNRDRVRDIAQVGEAFIGRHSLVPSSWPRAWIGGVYMPILNPHHPRDVGD